MDNQTEDLGFVGGTPVDKGTGIYVYPSADANTFGTSDFRLHAESRFFGPIEKALVKDLKYLDCVARGMKAPVVAFKWVPERLASFQSLHAPPLCGKEYCVRRCARYGCVCVAGECQ